MRKTLSILPLIAVLLAACSPAASVPTQAPEATPPEITVLVLAFGDRLKNVALLAPDAAQQIEDQYAEFVTPDLLAAWQADPLQAPGRLTSSPWPDEIRIYAIEPITDQQYRVVGAVVEVTSAEADMLPGYGIELTVSFLDGKWLISAYVSQLEQ
ncbi:MAG: hypothetical protein WD751_11365 [Anaerolineales bacterium]